MQNNILEGIQLEDVMTPEAVEEVPEAAELSPLVVLRSFIAPFAITILASWVIHNGAILVWPVALCVASVYLVRPMTAAQSLIVMIVYIPLMSFIMVYLVAMVPTGFHIVI